MWFDGENRTARSFWIVAAATTLLLLALAGGLAATAQTYEEGMRAYRSGNHDTAYRAFRALAEQGDRRSQSSLGDMYRKGYGVAQDDAEAVKWYGRAADQGSAYAQNSLGLMYRDGLGVASDPERAYAWFDLAARNFPVSRSEWRDRAARNRDRVAASLSPQALERAKRIAAEWRPGAGLVGSSPVPPSAGSGVEGAFDRNVALIAIVLVVLALVAIFFLLRSRSGNRRPMPARSRHAAADGDARPRLPEIGGVVTGKAYVTDGDGLRVSGCTIRIAGIDAPEHDQPAKHKDGYRIEHGKRVKSELIKAIGGKSVHVSVERHDRYGRVVGTVTCDGKDVGEWLVRNGYAFAAYSDRYKELEGEAQRAKRGMWGYPEFWHPQDWRHRSPGRG